MVGMSFSSVYAGIPWDTSEIADNAITSEKIKQRQVKSGDIKNNAVKTNKIRDGTITSADLAPGVGVPIGTVLPWTGPAGAPPDGFLLANGQAVDRTEFSDLFDLIGTTYGSGNGDTTYNIPDLNGRYLKGTVGAAGVTGGLSSHDHNVDPSGFSTASNGGSHNHNVPFQTAETELNIHNHQWSAFTSDLEWNTFNSFGNPSSLIDWTNGIDNEGTGIFPIATTFPVADDFYTTNDIHSHDVRIFGQTLAGGIHSHFVDVPPTSSSNAGNDPLFMNMVMIIRAK